MLPLSLLFALLVRVSHDLLYPDPVPADGAMALGCLGLLALGFVLLFEMLALWRLLTRNGRGWHARLGARDDFKIVLLQAVLPPLAYAALVLLWQWPVFVRYEIEPGSQLLFELLAIGPFFLFLLLSALAELRLGERLERSPLRLRSAIFLGVVYLALFAWLDLVRWPPLVRAAFDHVTIAQWALVALGIGVGLLLAPLWLGACFGLHRLRALDLHQHCAEIARRMRVRVGGLRVFDTRRRMLNAFVVGPFAWTRRVVFTDEMLRSFSMPELLAVLSHELAHVRGRHFARLILFALLLPLAIYAAILPDAADETTEIGLIVLLGVLFVPVLRWFRKRFEHEADLIGAAALEDPEIVVHTLERAHAHPGARRSGGFFYPSVDERVLRLKQLAADPGSLRPWQRRGERVQMLLFLCFGIAVGFVAAKQMARFEADRASFYLAAGFPTRAAELYLEHVVAVPTPTYAPAALEARVTSDDGVAIAPFDLDERAPSQWERLGEQIGRARLIVHQGELEGPELVPTLHRRALQRAAGALAGGDRESGRRWLRLASRFDDLRETEWALLRWLEAWRQQDVLAQQRAEAVLRQGNVAPPFRDVMQVLLK